MVKNFYVFFNKITKYSNFLPPSLSLSLSLPEELPCTAAGSRSPAPARADPAPLVRIYDGEGGRCWAVSMAAAPATGWPRACRRPGRRPGGDNLPVPARLLPCRGSSRPGPAHLLRSAAGGCCSPAAGSGPLCARSTCAGAADGPFGGSGSTAVLAPQGLAVAVAVARTAYDGGGALDLAPRPHPVPPGQGAAPVVGHAPDGGWRRSAVSTAGA